MSSIQVPIDQQDQTLPLESTDEASNNSNARLTAYCVVGTSSTISVNISVLLGLFASVDFQLAYLYAAAISLGLALVLFLSAVANDLLIRKGGRTAITCVAVVCAILYPFSVLLSFPLYIEAAVGVVLFACTILIWGSHLTTIKHQKLLIVTSSSFLISGLLLGIFVLLPVVPGVILVVTLLFLSFHCHIVINNISVSAIETASKELSRSRIKAVRGRRSALLTSGFILGCVTVMALYSYKEFPASFYVYGAALLISGLIVLLFRKPDNTDYEHFLRRSLALMFMIGMLPYPFVSASWKLAICFYLLCIALLNLAVSITAFVEVARFNKVSPIWTIGSETFIVFLGITLGQIVLGFATTSEYPLALVIACIIVAIGVNAAQMITDREAFDLLSYYIGEGDPVKLPIKKPKGGALWRTKIDVVADEYQLSARQKEVMELLARGRNIDYIMKTFYISRSTAKTHVYSMYKKLNIHTRQELLDFIEQVDPHKVDQG